MARRSRNEEAAMDSYFYARVRGEIVGTYAQAESDLAEKLRRFTALFEAQDREKRAQLSAGTITKAEYDSWLRGQVFRGERWKAVRQECVDQIHRANETTARMLNGERRALFQKAANYSAYQIERGTQGAVNFTLYDSATVTRLIQQKPKLLPDLKVGKRRDESWNGRGIQNAITQGIIQGESIPDIAKRIAHQTGERNRAALTRQARTAMTGAQNAGRVQAMWEAEDEGIKIQKKWIATLDRKTRDAHAELDGQVVDADQPFIVDGKEIMYPGDPNADPSLVYNCRCTLGWVYPDHPSAPGARRDNETGEVIGGVSYAEWEQGKTEPVKPEAANEPTVVIPEFIPAKTKEEAEAYASRFGDQVSYKGISLESCNAINEELNILTTKYPIRKYNEISQKRMKAVACASYRTLTINGSLIGKEFDAVHSVFEENKKMAELEIRLIRSRYPRKIPADVQRKIDKLETSLRFTRWSVSDAYGAKGTIAHEYGHTLADQYFGQINGATANPNADSLECRRIRTLIEDTRKKAWETGDIFGLTKYGSTDEYEFFAEMFAAREMGEQLPDYIETMLTEALSHGAL